MYNSFGTKLIGKSYRLCLCDFYFGRKILDSILCVLLSIISLFLHQNSTYYVGAFFCAYILANNLHNEEINQSIFFSYSPLLCQ